MYYTTAMALTVRLNPKTERALNALAKRRGLSRSDVVREAIEQYHVAGDVNSAGHPYEAWLDVIGVVALGVRDPARTTGKQFTAIISEKKRARHPR